MVERLSLDDVYGLACGPPHNQLTQQLVAERTRATALLFGHYSSMAEDDPRVSKGLQLLGQLPEAGHQDLYGDPQLAVLIQQSATRSNRPPMETLSYFQAAIGGIAIKRGVPFSAMEIPRHKDGVMVPGYGQAIFTSACPNATLEHTADGQAIVRSGSEAQLVPADPQERSMGWRGLKRMDLGFPVIIDDVSPYRGSGIRDAKVRTADSDWRYYVPALSHYAFMEARLASALHFIRNYMPEYETTLAQTLRVIVPLAATYKDARLLRVPRLGVIATTVLRDEEIVPSLIDGTLRGLFIEAHRLRPMHRAPTDEPRYYSPVSNIPVSKTELLATVTVAAALRRYWRLVADGVPDPLVKTPREIVYPKAIMEYARWDGHLRQLIKGSLDDRESLTEAGRVFASALTAYNQPSRPQNVLEIDARDMAQLLSFDHRVSWRLRCLMPDKDMITAIAKAWDVYPTCPKIQPMFAELEQTLRRTIHKNHERSSMIKNMLKSTSPLDGYARLRPRQQLLQRFQDLYDNYRNAILEDPYNYEAWAGFAFVHGVYHNDNEEAKDTFTRIPEVACAVYQAIVERRSSTSTDSVPMPEEVAAWLSHLPEPKIVGY